MQATNATKQDMPRRLLRLAATAVLAASALAASARPVTFGPRTLQVPEPQGFKAVAQSAPAFMRIAAAYLPASNRLVDVYVKPDAAATLAGGQGVELDQYFQLQVARTMDGIVISPKDFESAKGEIESSIQEAIKDSSKAADQLIRSGNAEVQRATSQDPKLSMSGLQQLGFFRREPWGVFFTVKTHVASAAAPQQEDMVGACAFVMVNYQGLFLYSYAHYGSEADRHWVEQSVSSWADALRAANPDDSGLESQAVHTGFDWNRVVKSALLWAVIGGLIGFFVTVMKKRQN